MNPRSGPESSMGVAHNAPGIALAKLGKTEEAIASFGRAHLQMPGDAEADANLKEAECLKDAFRPGAGGVRGDRCGLRLGPLRPAMIERLALTQSDRLLILAPHPDDDVIACSGVIQTAQALKLPLQIVYATCGDGNPLSWIASRLQADLLAPARRSMGLVRTEEARRAVRILQGHADRMVFLGYPDGSLLPIWRYHWGSRGPLRHWLTRRESVHYPHARRPGARYMAEELLRDLTEVLQQWRPSVVFAPHRADLHPDHRVLAEALRWAIDRTGSSPQPAVYAYIVHYPKWPAPRGYFPRQPMMPPAGLTGFRRWRALSLDRAAIVRKRLAITAHRSQYRAGPSQLLSFARSNELFEEVSLRHALPSQRPRHPDSSRALREFLAG